RTRGSPRRHEFHGVDDMPSTEIEEFAKILVRHVRDAAVRACDAALRPGAASPVGKRWREAASGAAGTPPRRGLPDCVDETIFVLLQAVDQGLLPIVFVPGKGGGVDLGKEGMGELSGWYMGTGGWRAQYSEERFVDDFADLDPG